MFIKEIRKSFFFCFTFFLYNFVFDFCYIKFLQVRRRAFFFFVKENYSKTKKDFISLKRIKFGLTKRNVFIQIVRLNSINKFNYYSKRLLFDRIMVKDSLLYALFLIIRAGPQFLFWISSNQNQKQLNTLGKIFSNRSVWETM